MACADELHMESEAMTRIKFGPLSLIWGKGHKMVWYTATRKQGNIILWVGGCRRNNSVLPEKKLEISIKH